MAADQTQLSTFQSEGPDLDLDGLSPKERRAYTAIELNNATIQEHATSRNISPSAVRTLLHRARRKLGEAPRIGGDDR